MNKKIKANKKKLSKSKKHISYKTKSKGHGYVKEQGTLLYTPTSITKPIESKILSSIKDKPYLTQNNFVLYNDDSFKNFKSAS